MASSGLLAGSPGAVRVDVRDVGGRQAVVADVGATDRLGAIDLADGEALAEAAARARESRVPFVAFVASSGAQIDEGIPALHGWGLAARELARSSGIIPIVVVVCGPAVSGPALLLGLADAVVMCEDAYAFVTGPAIVRQVTGVPISSDRLGGADCHVRRSGVATLMVEDRAAATEAVEELLGFLPAHCDELPPRWHTNDPAERSSSNAGDLIPPSPSGAYDVRQVIAAVVDDGDLMELRSGWATNLVTALATLDGYPVGILANQPLSIAGTLDIPASQKGARFVAFCDAFGLPIVTFVDTPGFYPGKDLEWRGMIRHGAQLAFTYARATVPRVSVTLRKSYGGAYIVMDSKHMGNDLALAWPSAEIAVMGARGAVEILHRRAEPDERARHEREYEERLLNPYVAAERGFVDAVVAPGETRRELCAALGVLETRRERLAPRAHDNCPL